MVEDEVREALAKVLAERMVTGLADSELAGLRGALDAGNERVLFRETAGGFEFDVGGVPFFIDRSELPCGVT